MNKQNMRVVDVTATACAGSSVGTRVMEVASECSAATRMCQRRGVRKVRPAKSCERRRHSGVLECWVIVFDTSFRRDTGGGPDGDTVLKTTLLDVPMVLCNLCIVATRTCQHRVGRASVQRRGPVNQDEEAARNRALDRHKRTIVRIDYQVGFNSADCFAASSGLSRALKQAIVFWKQVWGLFLESSRPHFNDGTSRVRK